MGNVTSIVGTQLLFPGYQTKVINTSDHKVTYSQEVRGNRKRMKKVCFYCVVCFADLANSPCPVLRH